MQTVHEIELPKVKGSTVDQLPENLYVPPKALLLLLDVFSGPMDFLLYLIQRKNLDILEVNLVEITDQYIAYIELMEDFEYELAGDYLAMAAYLAEIKSRILLPREENSEEEENDPKTGKPEKDRGQVKPGQLQNYKIKFDQGPEKSVDLEDIKLVLALWDSGKLSGPVKLQLQKKMEKSHKDFESAVNMMRNVMKKLASKGR